MAGSGSAHLQDAGDVFLRVEDLVVEFPLRDGRKVHAVSGISFDVRKGETLGIVGESGCGKSTTGRAIIQLPPPTSGSVTLEGAELTELRRQDARQIRTRMQMILQDPISSLNPRRKVRDLVGHGLRIWGPRGAEADRRIDEMLQDVGLDPLHVAGRRPHEFSGGQCQRICIARALVMSPELLICDEPVSALDVSVQAQILTLLEEMKVRHSLTMVFISHNLAVIKSISDRVIVLYLGKICEIAPSDALYDQPAHPYTQVLLASIPMPHGTEQPMRIPLTGDLPSPIDPPSGCRFHTRCPMARAVCADAEPEIRNIAPGHFVACHFAEDALASARGASTTSGERGGDDELTAAR
jgi:peptide/nickel transport system ATP-binding protein